MSTAGKDEREVRDVIDDEYYDPLLDDMDMTTLMEDLDSEGTMVTQERLRIPGEAGV